MCHACWSSSALASCRTACPRWHVSSSTHGPGRRSLSYLTAKRTKASRRRDVGGSVGPATTSPGFLVQIRQAPYLKTECTLFLGPHPSPNLVERPHTIIDKTDGITFVGFVGSFMKRLSAGTPSLRPHCRTSPPLYARQALARAVPAC